MGTNTMGWARTGLITLISVLTACSGGGGGGGDMTENAVALCPNCHRMMHSLNRKSDIDILILANKKKKI